MKYSINKLLSNNKIKSTVIFLLILSAGLSIGRITGTYIMLKVIRGRNYSLLLYRPPFKYMRAADMISDSNEMIRIEGYYLLLDYSIIDADLLIEKYKGETPLIRSTIIWLMSYSQDKDKALKFLAEEHSKTDKYSKRKILNSIERLDESFFKNFIKQTKQKNIPITGD